MEHIILINNALEVLFWSCIPLIAVVAVGGTIVSAVMASTGIQERSLSYAARVIIILGVAYFFIPKIISPLVKLAELSLQ